MKLDFVRDNENSLVLSDAEFNNEVFDDMAMFPQNGCLIKVENVKFIECKVSPGTCVIDKGVTLDHVEFADLDCGDALRINSAVVIRNVKVSGDFPPALYIKPEYGEVVDLDRVEPGGHRLDISSYLGEVEIIGFNSFNVNKNCNRHVTVRAKWRQEIDWKGLGIGPFSYWRIYLKKLDVFKATEGVFSLPEVTDEDYAETMREKELLEGLGLDFT